MASRQLAVLTPLSRRVAVTTVGLVSSLLCFLKCIYTHLLYYVSVFVCTVSVSGVCGGGVHVCTRCVSLCVCRCSEYICTEKLCVPELE